MPRIISINFDISITDRIYFVFVNRYNFFKPHSIFFNWQLRIGILFEILKIFCFVKQIIKMMDTNMKSDDLIR